MTDIIAPLLAGQRRVGTSETEVAAGHHGSRGGAWKQLYTDAYGAVQEVALGASGTVLTSTGTSSAPTMQTPGATIARKTADETVNNSATLQNDDHLFLSVAANTNYVGYLHLITNCASATPDIKVGFTVPAGAAGTFNVLGADTAVAASPHTVVAYGNTNLTASQTLGLADSTQLLMLFFEYRGAGTAGTLQFQWAQGSANPSNTQILTGSRMVMWQG